jgi:thymidylate synthase (FAD)
MSTWMLKQMIKDQLGLECIPPQPIEPELLDPEDVVNDETFLAESLKEPEIVVQDEGTASPNFIFVYGDGIGGVDFIDCMGNDRRIAEAARASFGKDVYQSGELRDKDMRLIKRLKKDGHTSPFEQIELVVKIVAPIFVARHFLRHRTFSVNEISRRFTSSDISFYYPDTLYTQAEKNLQCSTDTVVGGSNNLIEFGKKSTEASLFTYNLLLDAGVSREDARMFLPQNLYTSWWMKGNGHNWINMLNKRLAQDAQRQTRAIAEAIKTIFVNKFPFVGELAFGNDEATNDKK